MSNEPSTARTSAYLGLLKRKTTFGMLLLCTLHLACSASDSAPAANGTSPALDTGGATAVGGSRSTVTGGLNTGGVNVATGGTRALATSGTRAATGGADPGTGGTKAGAGGNSQKTGGAPATGGTPAKTGGAPGVGGATHASGGSPGTGGVSGSGGTTAAGGKSAKTGGAPGTGGTTSTGGASASGGTKPTGSVPTGGTSAGGSSSDAYEPCPTDGSACIILPFGDSITYGLQSADGGGYREPLFKKALAANQKITFTGSQTNGPATIKDSSGNTVTFPNKNEGHSGWTIDPGFSSSSTVTGISTLIPKPAFDTIPHIVLLMIGTNDVYAPKGQDQMSNRLDGLIDKIVDTAPKALLVVATLTPLSTASWQTTANAYNAKIPGIVQAKASAGKHVIMVDMSKMPTANLSDGVHPNDTGYSYMADVWYAAIKNVL